ncbi:transglycosylase SLT domain-containing protein [Acetobacter sp. LMG 32666]|uniref:transglycosylase SLT domain-containing protein n=1 Tax=Acetobacter sp. LMG 32666 TaxID=2959295 RepID=UPI0030C850D7
MLLTVCGAPQTVKASTSEQIVPSIHETGAPTFVYAGSSGASQSTGSSGQASSYSGEWGNTDAMATLLNQTYGSDAVAAAKAAGINPDTLAAFGQIESHYQNTGNSTSSAQGVWQITDGTWNEYAAKAGVSDGDRSDPAVQAKVASAIISDYATSVASSTHGTVTGAQAYGAYMFGTTAGSQMAAESNTSRPLSDFVSTKTLAANNMSNWTVGQYYSTVSQRMGSGASEAVIS